jgi:hypothetical protein
MGSNLHISRESDFREWIDIIMINKDVFGSSEDIKQ